MEKKSKIEETEKKSEGEIEVPNMGLGCVHFDKEGNPKEETESAKWLSEFDDDTDSLGSEGFQNFLHEQTKYMNAENTEEKSVRIALLLNAPHNVKRTYHNKLDHYTIDVRRIQEENERGP